MAATQSNTVAPNATEYGGDEISALVLDPGYSVVRAGFAGEDVPKSVVPSYYGILSTDAHRKHLYGENAIHNPLPNIEIENPFLDNGLVGDWDTATNLWEYAITSRLTNTKPSDPMTNGLNEKTDEMKDEMEGIETQERPLEENPLLITESPLNTGKGREKPIEIAMENWGTPAFWLARSGVLSAFSAGKPSALVIDIGASSTTVTPVHDGMMLRKGVARSPLAGNHISDQLRLLFSTSQPQPIPLTPHYLINTKTPVDAGAPAQASYRHFPPGAEPARSFRALQEERILTEFKESVVAVWSPGRLGGHHPQGGGTNLDLARTQQNARPFEMPDGYNQLFGVERYRAVESLFDVKMALSDAAHPAPPPAHTLPNLVQQSLSGVDVDIRPHLLANIVVVGGSSLIYGLNERLKQELEALYPGPRVRIFSPGSVVERKFSGWIGGSILASLGTFHQMWISKKEYDEHGPGIVEKRCK